MTRDTVKRYSKKNEARAARPPKAESPLHAAVRARLKGLRESRGWTHREVCDASGLTPQTYGQIELGTRTIDLTHIEKLAAGYGVAPGDILSAESGWSPLARQVAETVDAAGAAAAIAQLLQHVRDKG